MSIFISLFSKYVETVVTVGGGVVRKLGLGVSITLWEAKKLL